MKKIMLTALGLISFNTLLFSQMKTIQRNGYVLLLSKNPCEIFDHYKVDSMHGLRKKDCECHVNNSEQAYIAGWSNIAPDKTHEFVFINMSRANDDIELFALVMHELTHQSFSRHNYDINKEEEIITWAEEEAKEVYKLIKL